MTNQRNVLLAAAAFSLVGYIYLGYFTMRASFLQVLLTFALIFSLYLVILRSKTLAGNVKLAVAVALLFRFSLFFSLPNLTDDYFRFIWDGLLVASGHNPYLLTPAAFMTSTQPVPGLDVSLFEHLNSPDYYSVYPPLCQYVFGLSAKICGADLYANIILIRIFTYLAEGGSIWLLFKISKLINAGPIMPLIYALNPLVVIELSGNLHPEAMMIFLLLLALFMLVKGRQTLSAVSFGFAVGAKLIPLIFLPLLIIRLGISKSIRYFLIVGATFAVLFAPFLSALAVNNFISGLILYFRVFEFNASIYYLVRWIGYFITGYNTIAVTGVVLAVVSSLAIVAVACLEKQKDWSPLFGSMLYCLTIYFFFATTVHPWYLTTLVALSALTGYRYGLVWAAAAILSYSAYQTSPYAENLGLVAIEYLLVGAYMFYEMLAGKKLATRLQVE